MTEMLSRGAVASDAANPAGPWTDEVDDVLTCVGITDVTHDVKSFAFELPGRAQLRFAPGQYLTFAFPVRGEAVERCYTISSSPNRLGQLTITVKRVPDGPVSNWLHDQLRVGGRVRASGPFGDFSNAHHPAPKYLFLSAGSGITPLMSMTRTLCDSSDPTDVVFVHGARTPVDIIFRDELATIGERPHMSVAVVCEDDAAGERWTGARGRLSLDMLRALVPDLHDREIFTCGPPAYMESVRALLDDLGVDRARRHEESFRLGALIGAAEDVGPTDLTYRVEFRRSQRVVECDAGTTLLEGASQAGLVLPSSCGEGVCGTCKLSLLSGRVDMQHAGGIRPREIAQDKFLACCSKPLDDLVIDA